MAPPEQVVHEGTEGVLIPEVTGYVQVHQLAGFRRNLGALPKACYDEGDAYQVVLQRRGTIQRGKRPSLK